MAMCNSLTHSIKICLGVLLVGMGTIASSMSAFAQEDIITDPKPLEIHTGTVQDLGGTESKTEEEWLGGVGGEYATTEETTTELPGYEVDRKAYEARNEVRNVTLDEYDANVGDPKSPAQRIPLIRF